MDSYYNKIAKGYNELHSEEQKVKVNLIKNNINRTDKILDVGCGTGVLTFNSFFVGIDPSIGLLKLNKNKVKINGIAENLPFKDKTFDIVISITAVHNFNDIEKGLDEIKRVGKNNFIFTVLKKSKKFNMIKRIIDNKFEINKAIEEEKDTIFFTSKRYL